MYSLIVIPVQGSSTLNITAIKLYLLIKLISDKAFIYFSLLSMLAAFLDLNLNVLCTTFSFYFL